MKSYAPSFIDSMTDCVVPKALVSTTIALGSLLAHTLGQQFQPAVGLQVRLGDEQIGVFARNRVCRLRRPAWR